MDSADDEPILPTWPDGTVLILVTGGEPPHAIPVSAAVRAGPVRALLGLARTRESLARLRDDPRVAVSITAAGIAVTAYGVARVREEELAPGVAGVEVAVDRIQDHGRPTFVIEEGVRWHWTEGDAATRDAEVRRALERLV
jgi:hypothetical protein